jgi:hypothetical protein
MQILERAPLILQRRACEATDLLHDDMSIALITEPRPGEENLYLLAPRNAETCQVAGFTAVKSPRWSPDGRRLAFTAESFTLGRDVFTFSASGDMRQRITEDDVQENALDWSPDGQQLVYSVDSNLHFVSLDEKSATPPLSPISMYDGLIERIDWSHDGSHELSVNTVDAGHSGMFIVNLNDGSYQGARRPIDQNLYESFLLFDGDIMGTIRGSDGVDINSRRGDWGGYIGIAMQYRISSPVWLPRDEGFALLMDTTLGKAIIVQLLQAETQVITGVILDIVSFDWR